MGENPRFSSDWREPFLSLLQDAKSMWAITSVSVRKQSWKQSYLPILLGYFSKKVNFSLGYRESLCRLTTL